MIKYKAQVNKISKIEIDKETEKTVTLKNGRREHKESEYHSWHNSFDDAKQYLVHKAQHKIDSLERRLQYERDKLAKINNLNIREG